MAHQQTLAPLSGLLCLFLVALLMNESSVHAGNITVYWGNHGNDGEGSLYDACESGLYEIVNIAFLSQFGNGQEMKLDLSGHCSNNDCSALSRDIRVCQCLGVKVFLSIGGSEAGTPTYTLSSEDDARQVASDIWNKFLGGESEDRPLGKAVLDGVDFYIQGYSVTSQYWDVLATELASLGEEGQKKLYLSAAPQCTYPDPKLDAALKTGVFDYVWIQYFFYNSACQYYDNEVSLNNFKSNWETWTTTITANYFYLGLPAIPEEAESGYIDPETLITVLIPVVSTSTKYGGVMVWDRYHDVLTNYSQAIKPYVLNSAIHPLSSII